MQINAIAVNSFRAFLCSVSVTVGLLHSIFFLEVLSISTKELLINEEIKASQVRLVGTEGEQLGIFNITEALNMAYNKGLDLVEMAPGANPPVCRVMDYGKYRFEREKKEKESRKKQTVIEIKEIKFSCRIDKHDFQTKINHAHKFLQNGNKVKITITFSGREMNRQSMGYELMEQVAQACEEFGSVDKKPSVDGRYMTMFIVPKAPTSK
ncbi:MAG: translation initiation factor IF-3 [Clostridia bacterium]|nr:translation initiation factor IF-3 [Clostridia bacterium]